MEKYIDRLNNLRILSEQSLRIANKWMSNSLNSKSSTDYKKQLDYHLREIYKPLNEGIKFLDEKFSNRLIPPEIYNSWTYWFENKKIEMRKLKAHWKTFLECI